ncbi:hypothetical protein GALMADRAFT_161130 [Galerina marginata CBS 339.88]|uniref:HECT-type E3 ubiquitin transferase n=1 Tax=Galerina marginata (strain CBS 339.88) TaxID=685588 RepID=A0A067SBC4_GALM3|nr:hypothetical protein GALMADRAFT_161130 [Galerina marginata CBS 339.88]
MPHYSWFTPLDETQKSEKAAKIQMWWRRMLAVRAAKKPLRTIFEGDVTGLTGLRCLLLIGAHDDVLGTWARAMIQLGPEAILDRALGEQGTSWLVLIRKAAFLLVQSLADAPESPNAAAYLDILMVLLSKERAVASPGAQGIAFCQAITAYLMKKEFYGLLRKSISKLPIETSTSLHSFLTLCTLPLLTYPESSPQYTKIYVDIFVRILSLPLLPNRLPPDIPSPFISYFLLTHLDKLADPISSMDHKLSPIFSPDLAANLFMFVSPHYETLSPAVFASYLQLSTKLINMFNSWSWLPSSSSESGSEEEPQAKPVDYDSDFSDGYSDYGNSQLDDDYFPDRLEVIDESIKWLAKIATSQHITKLMDYTQSQAILLPHLAAYLFTVTATWPSSQQEIQSIVLASSSGRLVGRLYRTVVRKSPLGQDEDSMNIYQSASAIHWPPLIFLADIYSQALRTMDEEVFFGTAPMHRGSNPLSLGEVATFSAQLLNIVFSLHWQDSDYLNCVDSDSEDERCMHVSSDVYCSWTALKVKLLRCLLRIHARDSRQPFLFLGHWLLRSRLDMNSFVDAAVISDQRSSWTSSQMQSDVTRYHREFVPPPQLSILKTIPFAIPFEVRVAIFQHLIVNDRTSHGSSEQLNALGHDPRAKVKIRRSVLARDGFDRLDRVDLKAPLQIVITDEFGQEEEGIDGGSQFKEFFTSFWQQVLHMYPGLWLKTKRGELYPTLHGSASEGHILDWYWFIGRMIGKAMYEGILVGVTFANFFLSKWLGRRSYFDDLISLDPGLHRRLLSHKHSRKNIEDLSLYFTIATEQSGVAKTVDLIPNGSEIAVTKENRLRYINLSARYRLNVQLKRQSEAFLEGLSQLIQPKWLKMFNPRELQILIGGTFAPTDLDDLRRHTNYGGIYHNGHETIIHFWRVVNSFHQWQKHTLLRFVTSCSRSHALGFKELVPNFSIRDDGPDEDRLPTSSTSVNLLKLPMYKSERQLREMLLEAVIFRAGFDSS